MCKWCVHVRVFWQHRLLVSRWKCLPHRGDSTCQSGGGNALIKHFCWQLWLSLPDTQHEAVRLAGSRRLTHMHRHTHAYTHKLTLNSKIKPLNKCERYTLGTYRLPLQRLVTKVQSLQSGWCLLQHMHHSWQQSEGNIPVLFLSMLRLSAITQKLNANPFKMNLKFNDKSQANVNRSV